MAKHAKSALPRIESGTADRDCYLDTQTIRNIAAKQAKFTWKRHPNESQSVRLFYQEHSEHTFIYQEEQSSQPQQAATAQPASSAEHQVSRRFAFGWTPPAMLANILLYGNDNVVLLDATFGTNRMKMPLYTGLVMDDFGNGLPGFMILCQGVSEDDWLQALLKKLRLELHDWMCSCVMVDDAIAEINAIKTVFGAYGVRVFLCFWHVKRSWLKNLHRKCPRSVQYQMFLSMEKIMLMLPSIDQSKESFTQQVHDAVDIFCTQYAEQADYVFYFQKQWGKKTDEWVRGFRDVPHAQQNTTGACEGYHSAIKGNELSRKSRLLGRRVDSLLWLLWTEVDMRIQYKQAYKKAGFMTNRKAESVLTSAVIAAQAIPDSFVELLDSSGAIAHVTSISDLSVKYQVTYAGGVSAKCNCPQGRLHYMCKHVVKVISLSPGYTDAQIIQALGTRAGTSMQGLHKLHSNTAGQPQTQVDPLADLEDMFAVTSAEPEQAPAAASVPVPAPGHDSAACQQQVETTVQRMLGMVANNEELQQHLVSHLNRTEGTLARIQASHQNGSAHPMASLSRVQDTWGHSLVRRRVMGLDAAYPKSKRTKTAQQPTEAGQSAEPEAELFSKPKPTRAKVGPRQQMRAAGEQENNSAAANTPNRLGAFETPKQLTDSGC